MRNITLIALVVCGSSLSLLNAQIPNYYQGKGRIAISTDGNQHDRDDYGATPTYLAFIAAGGLQDKLVHFQFSNHIWDSRTGIGKDKDDKEDSRPIMREGAYKAGEYFGFDTSRFFEVNADVDAATHDLEKHINASSSDDPLYILCGGPMETVYRAVAAAHEEKRQYVRLVSHSAWNDKHGQCIEGQPRGGRDCHPGSHQKDHILALPGVNPEQWIHIQNQNYDTDVNIGLNTARIEGKTLDEKWAYWDFMLNSCHRGIRFTRKQMYFNRWSPDISDAGMAYYLLTGDEVANPRKTELFFKRLGCDENTAAATAVETINRDVVLTVGEARPCFPIVLPVNAANKEVTYRSSDKNIACVNRQGLMRALKAGKADIRITTVDGKHQTTVKVFVSEQKVEK